MDEVINLVSRVNAFGLLVFSDFDSFKGWKGILTTYLHPPVEDEEGGYFFNNGLSAEMTHTFSYNSELFIYLSEGLRTYNEGTLPK